MKLRNSDWPNNAKITATPIRLYFLPFMNLINKIKNKVDKGKVNGWLDNQREYTIDP